MNLNKLLKNFQFELLNGSLDIEINNIQYDSRKINKGDVFFCIEGLTLDGHKYIKSAIDKGAVAIIVQKEVQSYENVTLIKVKDTRKALALASSNFYDNPSKKLKLIGITGTNGKTTSTFMVKSILEQCGHKVGLIGTIANYIGDKKLYTERTTPESLELHQLFNEMVKEEVEYCVMEVSSHSLELDRVYGVEFSEGIFTNLTQDHLDFHKTFENYFNAKLKLFLNSKVSIVNIDDSYGERIIDSIDGDIITYGLEEKAMLWAKDLKLHSRGIEFTLVYNGDEENIKLSIPGKYNVYNALGCIAATIHEGVSIEDIKQALEKVTVPGRCEIVTINHNLGYDVIVDYAHTPDGLENILNSAREFTFGRLISVFGCGGDRDKSKRPIMGSIGSSLSDITIITSDNPRTEDPMAIIEDIKAGLKKENYVVIENRREAIKYAMKIAKDKDVIVIAGKGHEDYQVLKDKRIHFDEREIISEIIKELYA
ncbi:UDP-N-acetylmuramyl-tripeptide synthetase family protein [Clostridium argentinense CDC 2741]|uniref:UDP-N-acetylmuramoyl-L-alanyl-D-glutamate--2,6-diaminopimelate ligase n=1 Tax=Clostridium argentinense CDC 2741 TaxID=1418104 RepID=A0A0C1U2C7_9CLOT|nr:UDP-N-acetylmuramoyl-L-alanyl-D-glutamate--2,6-diaminopimelate ligase [Clostridium argentinense]ARC85274.1 UDP-N-acetylmuramoyl-L-alanyl-D-glutamate--2,6-diaminopimelate ligase [Clostridium argentinense]KIE46999.1 UDP-N-acetylmuramyl-tripeptide synthetase family protein [Clostridium argentinense CDC 2741]NFF40891.1 UDP-N-acetylmuramoyl-L-alanyl-D-glutamate--2,6-diaminopimelate ligase [Clostridium argentinense]NFP51397.1 UDP-N-acetylmuramoyl-L-alanyl-D-glutamate--2,6-diaminopimelate ligase [C